MLLAASLMAAPRLVTVQDTLYKADGTKFNGVLLIDWHSFQASDSSELPRQSLVVPVTDGALRVLLTPTTTAQGSAYYNVRYNSDGRVLFSERWYVPPSNNVLTLSDVRTPPTTGGGAGGLTSILISDVTGLSTELAARPTKDPSFVNNRVMVATSTGTIGSASGNSSDCLKVDGSSAPCAGGVVFTDGEAPFGTLDGVNNVFSLAASPNPASSLALFRNGVYLKRDFDYTISGSTVTFVAGATPQIGDSLVANYRGVAATTINAIVIWNRTDCCGDRLTDYWVFVSNTPFDPSDTPATLQNRVGTWNTHQTSAPGPLVTISTGGITGRYVRVQLSGTNNLSLAEVQVIGSNATVANANLALGKTASQSSTRLFSPAGPEAAIDGNTDGDFTHGSVTHTNADPYAWWQVDLGL